MYCIHVYFVICKHWNVTLFLSYFFQCPFVNLARLLRFAFFQSLCMIFFRNMRLILRCLRRSIVNSVAANRCSTSGLLSGNAFFFFWPLTGRCTRGTNSWLKFWKGAYTTTDFRTSKIQPSTTQVHLQANSCTVPCSLVEAGRCWWKIPRMHMYNCYVVAVVNRFHIALYLSFIFVHNIVKRYPSHMSECKCTHAA